MLIEGSHFIGTNEKAHTVGRVGMELLEIRFPSCYCPWPPMLGAPMPGPPIPGLNSFLIGGLR